MTPTDERAVHGGPVDRPSDLVRLSFLGEGPLLVEGPVEIVLADGTVRRCDRPVVALCMCRRSLRAPFCDTSHRPRLRPSARKGPARDKAARDKAARDKAARDESARDESTRDESTRDESTRDGADRADGQRRGSPPSAPPPPPPSLPTSPSPSPSTPPSPSPSAEEAS
ncbi:CDGSH iron-sulfur domain-containing protein [Streptomyces sp. NPDC013740]|uniref:CDGSH iron-sulfur domain-containing protein n=1 Tax=Streptomyces sp. NPDC013740 TaxID=3364867 RepID=UPI0036F7BB91